MKEETVYSTPEIVATKEDVMIDISDWAHNVGICLLNESKESVYNLLMELLHGEWYGEFVYTTLVSNTEYLLDKIR